MLGAKAFAIFMICAILFCLATILIFPRVSIPMQISNLIVGRRFVQRMHEGEAG
jgi:hypothetical protein